VLLYKLRNKVAHNRHVKKEEYEKVRGLVSQIKEILAKASAKVGEIDLSQEDRELIIYSYNSDSPFALGFIAEKAVAEFYEKSGYQIISLEGGPRSYVDFYATKDGVTLAIDVKAIRPRQFLPMMRMAFDRQLKQIIQQVQGDTFSKLQVVVVLCDNNESEYSHARLFDQARRLTEEFGSNVEIQFGHLNDELAYVPIDAYLGA
jgi:Holliday junction resolvase-like predicted endonuclease